MLRADDVTVRDVTVRGFPGEGVSYQACRRTILERVTTQENAGNGLHPGSGSIGFRMRDVVSRRNGRCGVFYCMNVHYGVLENALLEGNRLEGVSIGNMDSDQLLRSCTVRGNGGCGMSWRKDDVVAAAHRVALVDCRLEDNAVTAQDTRAELYIPTHVDDIYLGGCVVAPATGVSPLVCADPTTRITVAETQGLDESPGSTVRRTTRQTKREQPPWLDQMPADADWHLPSPDAPL
jgi:hypothetical protein